MVQVKGEDAAIDRSGPTFDARRGSETSTLAFGCRTAPSFVAAILAARRA